MLNKTMQTKLFTGDALDVRKIGKEIATGVFELEVASAIDKDYCDAETECWIWSIGRRETDGKIFASTDNRFYQNPAYECLWLR